ncbi:MAG: SPOR domain-containing protein [Mariprofundaceae bacterium]
MSDQKNDYPAQPLSAESTEHDKMEDLLDILEITAHTEDGKEIQEEMETLSTLRMSAKEIRDMQRGHEESIRDIPSPQPPAPVKKAVSQQKPIANPTSSPQQNPQAVKVTVNKPAPKREVPKAPPASRNIRSEPLSHKAAPPSQSQKTQHKQSSSNMLVPALISMFAVLLGSYASWSAYESSQTIDQFRHELRNMEASILLSTQKKIVALQKRLNEQQPLTPQVQRPVRHIAQATTKPVMQKKQRVTKKLTPVLTPIKKTTPKSINKPKGNWVINVASFADMKPANQEVKRLRAQNIQAELQKILIKNKPWYRVVITGFSSKSDANTYNKALKKKSGLKGWVGRN